MIIVHTASKSPSSQRLIVGNSTRANPPRQPTTIIAQGGPPAEAGIPTNTLNPAWRFLLPLFGLWLLLYGSYALSRPPLPDGPATIHAEIAREMLARHDWNHAYINSVPDKSPTASDRALNWSIAASFKLFGVADWSARLPIALCVLALAAIAFFFGRGLFASNAAGLYASLIVLCWPGTFVATRELTTAPIFCLEIAAIAYALWYGIVRKKLSLWSSALAIAAVCAIVLLTQPWGAAALPLTIGIACWLTRRDRPSASLVNLPLSLWAVVAVLLSQLLEPQSHSPWTWLGPIPPLALLLAGWLANHEAAPESKTSRRLAYAIFAVGTLAAAFLIFLAIEGPLGFNFFTSDVLPSGTGRIPFIILAATLIAGTTGNLFHRLHHNPRVANCCLAGMLGGMIVAIQAVLVLASPFSSSQILANAIRPELESTDIIVVDGKYDEASSFAFYLERPVSFALPPAANPPANPPALPAARPPNSAAIDQLWPSTARVYLWTQTDHPFPVPGQSYVIAASGGKEILSNQPNSGGASF